MGGDGDGDDGGAEQQIRDLAVDLRVRLVTQLSPAN